MARVLAVEDDPPIAGLLVLDLMLPGWTAAASVVVCATSRGAKGRLAERCVRRAVLTRAAAALAELVEDGTLTPAQAETVKEKLADGRRLTGGPATPGADARAPLRPCARILRTAGLIAAVGDIVGLAPEEVLTRLAAGQSLAEIGETEGVSREDLIAGLEAAIAERLDAAVAAGLIDDEERDRLEAGLRERLDELVDRRRGGDGASGPTVSGGAATPTAAATA